jgi:hypothetical protein
MKFLLTSKLLCPRRLAPGLLYNLSFLHSGLCLLLHHFPTKTSTHHSYIWNNSSEPETLHWDFSKSNSYIITQDFLTCFPFGTLLSYTFHPNSEITLKFTDEQRLEVRHALISTNQTISFYDFGRYFANGSLHRVDVSYTQSFLILAINDQSKTFFIPSNFPVSSERIHQLVKGGPLFRGCLYSDHQNSIHSNSCPVLPCDVSQLCDSKKCLNGGTCLASIDGPSSCKCLSRYTGSRCEEALGLLCDDDSCGALENRGVCDDSSGSVNCKCKHPFYGKICAKLIETSWCSEAMPCQNNGICYDMDDGYKCICRRGE